MEPSTVCTSALEITQSRLSKESGLGMEGDDCPTDKQQRVYPFALVLRLRVLQIVCGISSLVMGTVAFIEEHGEVNLGLGMPAGVFTVIAAGVSIHTSRGWPGYREPSCRRSLRWLGPTLGVGAASGLLWGSAACLHLAVLGFCLPAVLGAGQLAAVAVLLALFSGATLLAVLATLHLDCAYDPD